MCKWYNWYTYKQERNKVVKKVKTLEVILNNPKVFSGNEKNASISIGKNGA